MSDETVKAPADVDAAAEREKMVDLICGRFVMAMNEDPTAWDVPAEGMPQDVFEMHKEDIRVGMRKVLSDLIVTRA